MDHGGDVCESPESGRVKHLKEFKPDAYDECSEFREV
jgi:hypothetical protein